MRILVDTDVALDDPQVPVPASEAWLYGNPEALERVLRGLQDVAEGRIAEAGFFAEYSEE